MEEKFFTLEDTKKLRGQSFILVRPFNHIRRESTDLVKVIPASTIGLVLYSDVDPVGEGENVVVEWTMADSPRDWLSKEQFLRHFRLTVFQRIGK